MLGRGRSIRKVEHHCHRVEWVELNKPFLAQGAFTGGFVAHPATRKIT